MTTLSSRKRRHLPMLPMRRSRRRRTRRIRHLGSFRPARRREATSSLWLLDKKVKERIRFPTKNHPPVVLLTGSTSRVSSQARRHGAGNTAKSAKSMIWLAFLDTYRAMCLAHRPDFRRVLEDVLAMQLAA